MQAESTAYGFPSRITISDFWFNAELGLSEHLLYAVMLNETKEWPLASDSPADSSIDVESQAELDRLFRPKPIQRQIYEGEVEFERALTDWIIRHRAKWRHNRQLAAQ